MWFQKYLRRHRRPYLCLEASPAGLVLLRSKAPILTPHLNRGQRSAVQNLDPGLDEKVILAGDLDWDRGDLSLRRRALCGRAVYKALSAGPTGQSYESNYNSPRKRTSKIFHLDNVTSIQNKRASNDSLCCRGMNHSIYLRDQTLCASGVLKILVTEILQQRILLNTDAVKRRREIRHKNNNDTEPI